MFLSIGTIQKDHTPTKLKKIFLLLTIGHIEITTYLFFYFVYFHYYYVDKTGPQCLFYPRFGIIIEPNYSLHPHRRKDLRIQPSL